MARPRKPWYRKSRDAWFVEIDGKQHNLGPDKDEAMKEFQRLMAEDKEMPVKVDSLPVMLDAFISYCHDNKALKTAQWHEHYLQDFLDYLRTTQRRPASLSPYDLKPKDIRAWTDARETAKRARITSVKAALAGPLMTVGSTITRSPG